MSSRDAAMLLVAIASSDEINQAAECASKTRDLPLDWRADPSVLCKLIGGVRRDYATFGISIDAIMKYLGHKERDEQVFFQVHLHSGRPYWASIMVHDQRKNHEIKFESPPKETIGLLISRGLNVRRTIVGEVTSYIAGCIAGRKPVLHPEAPSDVHAAQLSQKGACSRAFAL